LDKAVSDILKQLESETAELLRILITADKKLPRNDRGNFQFVECWTRKYGAMSRADAEKVLESGSLGLPGGHGNINSTAEIPPEYDRDLVRHNGLERGYLEVSKVDIDALRDHGLIHFGADNQLFSLTPRAKSLDSAMRARTLSKAKELLVYRDEEQPWFSKIPELQTVSSEIFTELQPEVVILTAVNTERDMVLRSMKPLSGQPQIAKVTAGPDTFYVGLLGQHQTVLVMSDPGAIGRSASILTTADAIQRWNPKAVIAVGFAFGMDPDKQQIADILISRKVTSYEPQRVQDDVTIPRGSTVEAGQHLVNRFVNVHGWEFRRPDGSLVSAKAGQILSGEKLVDSVAFKQYLLEEYPEALGGEMEGAGLFAAADRTKVEWIIVKAICDWGDGNKQKKYQPLAAAAAVSLVEHVLREEETLSGLRRPRETAQPKMTSKRREDSEVEPPNTRNVISVGEHSVAVGGDLTNSTIDTGDNKN
jgi:nucleoside phosphorylase